MSTQWVVVSPHFDDAALSVGALIAARTAAGDSVEVLTVYTDGPPVAQLSGRTKIFGDYPTRRAEDDRALRLLGATAARLGLRERLFRNPLPRRPIQVFRTPRRAAQFERCTAVQEAVAARLRDPETRVLAPLGVGNHYDHVEVAVAAIRAGVACDATDRIRFYEDFNALSELCRRRHPVARTAPHPWWAAPAWAGLASGAAIEAMALAVRGPSSATLAGQDPAGGARWTAHRVPVGTYEAAKLRAVAEYRTQTAVLGGPSRIAAMLRRAHRRRGGEMLWELTPAGRSTACEPSSWPLP